LDLAQLLWLSGDDCHACLGVDDGISITKLVFSQRVFGAVDGNVIAGIAQKLDAFFGCALAKEHSVSIGISSSLGRSS
jgi:hypothetical protein